ncbi:hypothetical protein B0T22DRAFT_483536 [Podospora appendiculata]|uniref:Myb-like DNA-binding domain-containing protein n=1 Tax=Podospora appendiculata TaxID=314037 RepID=A0AAE0X2W8_9PEZI|nr:hypothetical protein B0T22DRAFT_483536 [Podospora appendiculata]
MGKVKTPASAKAAPSGPPAPTPQEALFFFNIIKNMRNRPDIDWNAVATDSNLKNSDTAKVRFGQIKRKHGLENWGTSAASAGKNNNNNNNAAGNSNSTAAPTPTRASAPAPSTPRGAGAGVRKRASTAKKASNPKLTAAVSKALGKNGAAGPGIKKETSADGEDDNASDGVDDEEDIKDQNQDVPIAAASKDTPARPLKVEEDEEEEDENDGSEEEPEQDGDEEEMAARHHAAANARRSIIVAGPIAPPKFKLEQQQQQKEEEEEGSQALQLADSELDWSQFNQSVAPGGGYQDWGLQVDGASSFDGIPDIFGGSWDVPFGGK